MRVAITGASGLVGRAVSQSFESDGHTVHRLVRRAPTGDEIGWSVAESRVDSKALEGVDAVVHLAGEPISQRWTAVAKDRILASRRDGTLLLAQALAGLQAKPGVFVSASAIGFFGNSGDAVKTEDDGPGTGFLAEVAQAWEAGTLPAKEAGIRVVNFRVGIVMAGEGGALKAMLPAFRMGVGGPLAGGQQWMSWVSLPDLVRGIRFCVDNDTMSGPVHGTSPNPVRQKDFARALGRALGRPAFIPAPGFAIRLLFGEMGQGAVLDGQRCASVRLSEAGFEWTHPDIDGALAQALS